MGIILKSWNIPFLKALAGKINNLIIDENGDVSSEEKPDIPENHLSFLPLEQHFANLYVYAFGSPEPLAPPITAFALVGDYTLTGTTGFKNSLLAGRRYYFETRLILPRPTSGYTEFQLRMNCPSTWGVTLWSVKINRIPWAYPDITEYPGSEPSSIRKFEKNTIYSFAYEEDSGILFSDILIAGTIDTTGDDGEITCECRNIVRDLADNTNSFIIDIGSYMRSIECSIN